MGFGRGGQFRCALVFKTLALGFSAAVHACIQPLDDFLGSLHIVEFLCACALGTVEGRNHIFGGVLRIDDIDLIIQGLDDLQQSRFPTQSSLGKVERPGHHLPQFLVQNQVRVPVGIDLEQFIGSSGSLVAISCPSHLR